MGKNKPGIIFMGTPQFAIPSLEILIRNNYPVMAVVTTPDKPSGRGLRMREPAVKLAALANNIPVFQPANLKDPSFAGRLRELSADLFVVVAFRMLPEVIWAMPPLGTINLHASLLPLYRGAAPINHAIINGERVTGVTTFLIEKEIDKGNILLQERIVIGDDDNAGDLHDRLMVAGAGLILRTIGALTEGVVKPVPQNSMSDKGPLPLAPKINKADCLIDWSEPADRLFDFVRGLSPYPGAWTNLESGEKVIKLKVLEVRKIADPHGLLPGQVTELKNDLVVATGKGSVLLKYIQPEGRKAMTGSEFLRGFRPGQGAVCR